MDIIKFKNTKQSLEKYAEECISAMKRMLDHTDNLKNSISYEIVNTKEGMVVQFAMPDYAVFVNDGRRAGAKPPPVAPIKQWIKDKNIGLPEGAAYPIAKSIGEKGIKPLNVTQQAFKDVQKSIEFRRLEDGVGDWVDDLISDKLKGFSKRKNITFK